MRTTPKKKRRKKSLDNDNVNCSSSSKWIDGRTRFYSSEKGRRTWSNDLPSDSDERKRNVQIEWQSCSSSCWNIDEIFTRELKTKTKKKRNEGRVSAECSLILHSLWSCQNCQLSDDRLTLSIEGKKRSERHFFFTLRLNSARSRTSFCTFISDGILLTNLLGNFLVPLGRSNRNDWFSFANGNEEKTSDERGRFFKGDWKTLQTVGKVVQAQRIGVERTKR